jgi:hypothetical protein
VSQPSAGYNEKQIINNLFKYFLFLGGTDHTHSQPEENAFFLLVQGSWAKSLSLRSAQHFTTDC